MRRAAWASTRASRESFTTAMNVVAGISALAFIVLIGLVMATLRRATRPAPNDVG
jgi:hypothetical protein